MTWFAGLARCFVGLVTISSAQLNAALAAASDDADNATISALDAGVEQWRSGLVFRSHFVYRQGSVGSKDAGLSGEFGSHLNDAKSEDRVTGVFHKRGDDFRFSADFGRPPVDVSRGSPRRITTNVSFDDISVGRLYLDYRPSFDDTVDVVNIAPRPETGQAAHQAGPMGDSITNPFSFGGGVKGSPLANFAARPGYEETVNRSVEKLDSDHLLVTMVRQGKGDHVNTVRMTFLTNVAPPVIERIDEDSKWPGGAVEHVVVATDFIKCGTGVIARRVNWVSWPLVPVGETVSVWVAKEWISEDLGTMPPSDEDFVLTIPATTVVSGIKSPPPPGTERRIDLSKLSVNDLNDPSQPVGMPAASPPEPSPFTLLHKIVFAALLTISLLGIGAFIWRRGVQRG